MQRAIELMMEEHRLIEAVLAALDEFAVAVDRGDGYERDDLGKFVTFIREYADARHHAKEEEQLFTAMNDHGFPRDAGPVAVMLHEHDLGRGLVGKLAELATTETWPADAAARIREYGGGFARMLRAHIDKEDTILYPMAMRALPAPVFEGVNARCDELDLQADERGDTERLEAIADELIDRYC